MHIAPPDRTVGEDEWRPFVAAQGFGHFVAPGRDREFPIVVPTQFVLEGDEVVLHLAAPNPVFDALAENPRAMMSVAGDWAFVPSDWKAIGDEDPALGIPTTYYGAVQLFGSARVHTEPAAVATVLRRQLRAIQPGTAIADPEVAHAAKLRLIRGITVAVEDVRAKFKYGGNVDEDHRWAVVRRLRQRRGPGDDAAARHVEKDPLSRRSAWPAVVSLAAAKVAFQLATADLYGAHRDEFYYLQSGHHLAWGYVDNPPLVPVLYRLQEVVFGHSVTALAVVPALLGGVYVVVAALITADLGGGRSAQVVAALVAWLGPLFLTTSHFLSTVSLDLLFWTLATWLVIRMVRGGHLRGWLAVGLVCGVALLNKDTIVFWAVAAGAGLLTTPQRKLLASRWLAGGVAIALVIVAPNLWWEVRHHWPTIEFLGHLRSNNSASDLSQFVPLQLGIVTIAGTVVWVTGLRAVMRRGEWRDQRWLAHGYAVAFVLLFALAGKAYYPGSWYLPLVAVGAVAAEQHWSRRAGPRLAAGVVVTGLVSLSLFTPVLPERVAVAAGFDQANKDLGGMLGWPHVVGQIASAAQAAHAADAGATGRVRPEVILTDDYSEAGAVDFYGPALGLPPAISGHNSFWLWGYGHPAPGATVIAVGFPHAFVARYWASVTLAATLGRDGAHIDPQEQGAQIWVCRDQRAAWSAIWPHAKHYD